jgi:hypothetical protein
VGIITLEDIMEEILGEELLDETDYDEAEQSGLNLPGFEMDKRERELARLKMLSGKLADDKLTSEEVQAITSHLTTNVPQIQRLLAGTSVLGTQVVTVDQIRQMVALGCKVMDLARRSDPDAIMRLEPASEDILYKRNKPSNVCTLILSGRVTVMAGKDLFRSEMGPWSLLGADSLEQEDGEYVPDYTAFVSSDSVRCLLITKANVRKCWLGYSNDADLAPRRNRKINHRDTQQNSATRPAVKRKSGTDCPEPVRPDSSPTKKVANVEYGQLQLEDDDHFNVQGGSGVEDQEGVELKNVDNPMAAARLRSNSLN